MKTIEMYAIELAATAIESHAEDDMNEDGDIADDLHKTACDLALAIARAIEANPHTVIGMVRDYQETEEASRG